MKNDIEREDGAAERVRRLLRIYLSKAVLQLGTQYIE